MRAFFVSISFLAGAIFSGQVAAQVKVGDAAPDMKLKGSDGKDYSLAQFKGEKAVVIAWYPMAFTGG